MIIRDHCFYFSEKVIINNKNGFYKPFNENWKPVGNKVELF
jgi:hypothetical protein